MMEKEIYLAAGCFWGAEKYFKLIEGITFTEVGFANGNTVNPSYKEVYTDTTGFAEAVHIRYDEEKIGLRFILEMYFKAIDPTSLNQQGEDKGTRYRTGIYYTTQADGELAEAFVKEQSGHYEAPICVEVVPLKNFYRAEDYHQDYLAKNPDGYCHLPIELYEYARRAKMLKQ